VTVRLSVTYRKLSRVKRVFAASDRSKIRTGRWYNSGPTADLPR